MATTFASLGLDHLSDDEKWQVFRDLEDELDASRMAFVSEMPEKDREVIPRLAKEVETNPEAFVPWEDVLADTRRMLADRKRVK